MIHLIWNIQTILKFLPFFKNSPRVWGTCSTHLLFFYSDLSQNARDVICNAGSSLFRLLLWIQNYYYYFFIFFVCSVYLYAVLGSKHGGIDQYDACQRCLSVNQVTKSPKMTLTQRKQISSDWNAQKWDKIENGKYIHDSRFLLSSSCFPHA